MDSFFYGRKDFFALIRKRVCDLKEGYRQNVALIGSRHVGKSSIFIKYFSDLDDSLVIPVYLDLENRDYAFFLSKFIRSILYNFAKTKKLSLSDDLVTLFNSTESFIPQTVSRARLAVSLAEQAKTVESYDVVLSLPEIFTQETNLVCVIVLDEFQVLDEFGIPNVFSRLADRITTQKACLYLIASSFEDMALRILSQQLTLLFGNFEVVNVMPFDLLQSQDFISVRLGQIKIGLQLKNFLADFTGGRPLYLDILIQELINLSSVYKQQEAYAPLVVQSLENLVFSRWGALSRHFELAINRVVGGNKSHRLAQSIIFTLAEGGIAIMICAQF
jgi:AAA+ ATPase superfamily predicted ATPase